MSSKARWIEIVSEIAEKYYDETEEHVDVPMSQEDFDTDETGDALNHFLEDFGLYLREGGYK